MKLSVVSPVFNAKDTVHDLVKRVEANIPADFDAHEIILVDDYSRDNSWDLIEEIAKVNPNVKGLKLSRNFGQHYAISAGLEQVTGDWVIVMDCDLQDRPEEFGNLYGAIQSDYQIALARRKERKDKLFRKFFSWLFYRVLTWLTGAEQDARIANFGIYSRFVIDHVVRMGDKIRYFPTMVKWLGFSYVKVDVQHAEREFGKSNYSIRKNLNMALNIILAYSDKPIRIIVKAGFWIAVVSFIFAIKIVIQWLMGGIVVMGYASLIVSIWFLSGVILSTLGIIGLYIGKIFQGVQNRPTFVIEKYANCSKTEL